jgi:hypothetical protein
MKDVISELNAKHAMKVVNNVLVKELVLALCAKQALSSQETQTEQYQNMVNASARIISRSILHLAPVKLNVQLLECMEQPVQPLVSHHVVNVLETAH